MAQGLHYNSTWPRTRGSRGLQYGGTKPSWNTFSGMPLAAKDLKKKNMSLTEQQHWMAFSLWLLAVQPLGSEDILPVGIELKHGNEHERHLETLKWHR